MGQSKNGGLFSAFISKSCTVLRTSRAIFIDQPGMLTSSTKVTACGPLVVGRAVHQSSGQPSFTASHRVAFLPGVRASFLGLGYPFRWLVVGKAQRLTIKTVVDGSSKYNGIVGQVEVFDERRGDDAREFSCFCFASYIADVLGEGAKRIHGPESFLYVARRCIILLSGEAHSFVACL